MNDRGTNEKWLDYNKIAVAGRSNDGTPMHTDPPLRRYRDPIKFDCRSAGSEGDPRDSIWQLQVEDARVPARCRLVANDRPGGHRLELGTASACRLVEVMRSIDNVQLSVLEANRSGSDVPLLRPSADAILRWVTAWEDADKEWPHRMPSPSRKLLRPPGGAVPALSTVDPFELQSHFPLGIVRDVPYTNRSHTWAWFLSRGTVEVFERGVVEGTEASPDRPWLYVVNTDGPGVRRREAWWVTIPQALFQLSLEHAAEALDVARQLEEHFADKLDDARRLGVRSEREIQSVRDGLDELLRLPGDALDADSAFDVLTDLFDPDARPPEPSSGSFSPWQRSLFTMIAVVRWFGNLGARDDVPPHGPHAAQARPARDRVKRQVLAIVRDRYLSSGAGATGKGDGMEPSGVSVSEFVEETGARRSTLSRALHELEKEGYMQRSEDEDQRQGSRTERWRPTAKAFDDQDDDGRETAREET